MSKRLRLEISIDDQRLDVFKNQELIRSFPISTSKKGVGFKEGSYRTPVGLFQISEKIGGDQKSGTIFKQRIPAGQWKKGQDKDSDLILSRILRLKGMQDENANTMKRFVYIHGTNQERLIGQPASMGCIRLKNSDVIELFDMVSEKSELFIHPPTLMGKKLMFFDCDSTLSSIEGIDELARSRGAAVYAQVVALTDAAMNGEIRLDDVFPRRMEIIQPDKKTCDKVAAKYIKTVMPGAKTLIAKLKKDGWLPVIISGGFAPLILPLAKYLGIEHVEAVPLYLDKNGKYAGYGTDYPTTRNLGKNEIIREWKQAMLPDRTAMMGDGISDLETKPDVDIFIGFGGVVARPLVQAKSPHWITSLGEYENIISILSGAKSVRRNGKGKIIIENITKFPLSVDKADLGCAPMSTSTKKTTKGKRYSPEEKNDIVAFVEKYNADNGRGGQSAAAKKYGISQLSISSWLKSSGAPAPTGARRGRKPGSLNKVKVSSGGSYAAKLGALSSLANQIDKAEADLDKLKAKFQSLKANL